MTQLPQLSNREGDVVDLLMQGMSNKQIAAALHITVRTVEFHLQNIYAKYQVSSRVELILYLGQTASRAESERLGESTVEIIGDPADNGETSNGQANWMQSLRETLSLVGKELRMQNFWNTDVNDETAPMTFQNAIRVCLSKYAVFEGQANRAEYWWFFLFVILVAAAFMAVNEILGNVFLIAMTLPLVAAGTRRLHDTGRSGWWQLFWLVPMAGMVPLAFVLALPGTTQAAAEEQAS